MTPTLPTLFRFVPTRGIAAIVTLLCVWPVSMAQPARNTSAGANDAGAGLTIARDGDVLAITVTADPSARKLALHIYSERNAVVPRFSDVSPLHPPAAKRAPVRPRESWFPMIDFEVHDDMEAIVAMADVVDGANYSWNGWAWREQVPLTREVRIPAERLLEWENTLWVDHAEPRIARLHVRKPLPSGTRDRAGARVALRLLDSNWAGRIELAAMDENGRESVLSVRRVDPLGAVSRLEKPRGKGFEPERLRGALSATIEHTLRSRIDDPRDPMNGGLYLFYDLDARTYRTPHWIWGWGPSAGLLLDARKRPEIAAQFGRDRLLEAAKGIGERSLSTVATGAEHPVRGIPISRWDRSPRLDFGHELAFTPCDAGFLAAWTWVRLEEATGDKKWREASLRLAGALDRLMTEFPIPPQNYWPDYGRWDDKVIDEAGFGVELFTELHRVHGDERMRDLGGRYIEQHLAALGREDGLWDRVHYLDGQPNMPTIRMTRGLGWPMEGLLAAHRLLPEGNRYLDLASQMAEHLLAAQKPEGYWVHRFDQPVEVWGIGTKGTALWSWLLYELHRYTGDPRHLAAARRALGWLLDEQYFGDDPRAQGGLIAVSPHSAVGYRPWFPVTCTYGAAFFGLAILQELQVQGK